MVAATALAVVFGACQTPATSFGAVVEVVEKREDTNHSDFELHDDGVEDNALTISILGIAVTEKLEVKVLDLASPLVAGEG